MKRERAAQTETEVGGMARERQAGAKSCLLCVLLVFCACSPRLDQLPPAQVCRGPAVFYKVSIPQGEDSEVGFLLHC